MDKSYSKKRDELVRIIKDMISLQGDSLNLPLISIKQHKKHLMYTTSMPAGAIITLFRRIPLEYSKREGIQRVLKDKKFEDIEKMIRSNKYTSPNAVVANISIDEKQWACKIENDADNSLLQYLTIDLLAVKKRLLKSEVDKDGYIINEDNATLGYLIDGLHRIEGIYKSGNMGFELPMTLYINLSGLEMEGIFEDINQNQEKPSQVRTIAMRALFGTLSSTDVKVFEIQDILNSENWSLLKKRIRDVDSEGSGYTVRQYMSSGTFRELLERYVLKHIKDSLSELEKAELLNDYFKAWKNVFEEAWNDDSKHVLVKSMGFQITMRLFSKIHSNAIIESKGQMPGYDSYRSVIEKALGGSQNITIEDGDAVVELPVNWASQFYGKYSSGKGINAVVNALGKQITNKLYV